LVWLGRIGGGILGFAVGVFFTEVVFPNQRETEPLIAVTLLVIAGVVAGSWLARRYAGRSARAT
jgi:uncharacterized protein YneF (UPF0154 family)